MGHLRRLVIMDNPGALMWLIVIATSVAVLVDASRLGARPGTLGGGLRDMSPLGWFFCCLLLWIVSFPVYLASRPKYVAIRDAKRAAPVEATPWRSAFAPAVETPAGAPVADTSVLSQSVDIPAQISSLAALHAVGTLSDDEFQAKKSELLARM